MTDAISNTDMQAFIKLLVTNQIYANINADGTVQFTDDNVHLLFQHLIEKQVSILPNFRNDTDFWMIVGEPQTKLDGFMRTISRFLVPTYATFSGRSSAILSFSSETPLGEAGDKLFTGYYRLVSRPEDRAHILKRLNDCLHVLGTAEPGRQVEFERQSYRARLDAFQRALTAHQWDEAERLLTLISSGYLTSTENVDFLRIIWLARQSRWHDIWEHPHFTQLATLPVPSMIRAAMLTAFHHVHLSRLEFDEDWNQIQELLKQHRPGLAMLLMGRFSLTQPAILRVYAYLALLDNDRDTLARIENDIPSDDFHTRLIIKTLLQTQPQEETPPDISSEDLLQTALINGDYDKAWHVSNGLTDAIQKLAARIQIAHLSQELSLAQQVLKEHQRLYIENVQILNARYPDVENWLQNLKQQVIRSETGTLRSWADWFRVVQQTPDLPELVQAFDQLSDEWNPTDWTNQEFSELANYLADITNEQYRQQTIYRSAIQRLTNACINADDFPRQQAEAADVYEFLLLFVEQDEHTTTNTDLLLRLQEALLANRISALSEAIERLQDWFSQPRPIFQDQMLEALELLAQYGAEPNSLYQWVRTWADDMSRSPVVEATTLSVWMTFARWIKADESLIGLLEERFAQQQEQFTDHLALLPDKTQIAIFTFDEAAAKRARDILLERNPNLDVRICTEHVNNKRVQVLAEKSDYVVLVTTCISHAIWYAVEPLTGDRLVLPRSRGASSILRALDEKFAQPVH